MVAIQPPQLGVLRKVTDDVELGLLVIRTNVPTYVGIPEAMPFRGVWILLRVAVLMMNSMVRCPPKHPFLKRSLCSKSHEKLEGTTRRIGPVRKITMICACYEEHSTKVKDNTNDPIEKSCARPDHGQRDQMDE